MQKYEISKAENGVLLKIKVRPNSDYTGFDNGMLRIKSPPSEGKANKDVMKFLAGLFGKQVKIIHGAKTRSKTILILGDDPESVRKRLP